MKSVWILLAVAIGLYNRYPLRTDQYLPKVKCPVFMIHGTSDRVIPVHHSKELFALITNPQKEYVEIPGGGHNDLNNYPAFREFLDNSVP